MTEAPVEDVIIVGAGPAGILAARHLQTLGLRYRLIEAQHFPRDKACADIITSKAIRELMYAFPKLSFTKDWFQPIWGTRLYVNDKPEIPIPFRALDRTELPSCYAIERGNLDNLLWEMLRKQSTGVHTDGIRVLNHNYDGKTHQLSLSDGTALNGKTCIIATGSVHPPFIRKALNSAPSDVHEAIGIRAYYRGLRLSEEDQCYLYLTKEWMPGGFYIAPLPAGRFNVNMVVRADKVKRGKIDLKAEMNKAIQEHPRLKSIFERATLISDVKGYPLKLATTERPSDVNGLILTGDAAGLIDLISANGIPQAMISGRLAAHCAAKIVRGQMTQEALGAYRTDLMAAIESDIALGKKLSPFLGTTWISQTLLSGMGLLAGSKANKKGVLEEIMYASDPWKRLVQALNPLRAQSLYSGS